RRHEHVLLLEQIEREFLIVERGKLTGIDAHEGIHGAFGWLEPQEAAAAGCAEDGPPRLVEPAAGAYQVLHALIPAERGLHRPLREHIAAQPQRAQQLERAQVVRSRTGSAGEHGPSDTVTA